MRCTLRSSSKKESARSHRKILRAISSFRRRSILILFCFCLSHFSENPSASHKLTGAGCGFIFSRVNAPEAFRDANLRGRYLETSQLAASYTHYLDTLNGVRRLDEIRRFHSLDYGAKQREDFGADLRPEHRPLGLCGQRSGTPLKRRQRAGFKPAERTGKKPVFQHSR